MPHNARQEIKSMMRDLGVIPEESINKMIETVMINLREGIKAEIIRPVEATMGIS